MNNFKPAKYVFSFLAALSIAQGMDYDKASDKEIRFLDRIRHSTSPSSAFTSQELLRDFIVENLDSYKKNITTLQGFRFFSEKIAYLVDLFERTRLMGCSPEIELPEKIVSAWLKQD